MKLLFLLLLFLISCNFLNKFFSLWYFQGPIFRSHACNSSCCVFKWTNKLFLLFLFILVGWSGSLKIWILVSLASFLHCLYENNSIQIKLRCRFSWFGKFPFFCNFIHSRILRDWFNNSCLVRFLLLLFIARFHMRCQRFFFSYFFSSSSSASRQAGIRIRRNEIKMR